MVAACTQCGTTDDHVPFRGNLPEFAQLFSYLVCVKCKAVFNAVNSTNYAQSDVNDICQTLLATCGTKLGCYIFGPASPGKDGIFRYEFDKRCQLKENLPRLSQISKLVAWARFPEDDMPSIASAPTGKLIRQEIRLIERERKKGVCPILVFLIYSFGTIQELEVAAAFPENSIVFVRDSLRTSLVGHDAIAGLHSSPVYFYSPDGGCHLRAFTEDFLIDKAAEVHGLVTTEQQVRGRLASLGIRMIRKRAK